MSARLTIVLNLRFKNIYIYIGHKRKSFVCNNQSDSLPAIYLSIQNLKKLNSTLQTTKTQCHFSQAVVIALENDISSQNKEGGKKSHLRIMSLISKEANHICEALETGCQYLCQTARLPTDMQGEVTKLPGKPAESATPSFQTFLSSTLKTNCINTEKLLM